MAKLEISPEAKADLIRIGDYISERLQNPQAALSVIRKIKDSMSLLTDFPESGTLLQSNANKHGYRYAVCGSYMVFYHADNDCVLVDRVLYGRSDYIVTLFGNIASDYEEY